MITTGILCVGLSPALDVTYRVERFAVGAAHRVLDVATRPGGKALNVARVLHGLGEPVRALLPAGGPDGEAVVAALNRLGVPADVVPSSLPTRRTVTVVDDAGATLLSEPAGIDCWPALFEQAREAVRTADLMVLSGRMPAGAPDDATAQLVALAREAGRPVVVDTSGSALGQALAAGATAVKPNVHELAELHGNPLTPAEAGRVAGDLSRRYGVLLLVSLGPDGLLAADGDRLHRARPGAPLAGNPTGAGDAAVAGLARGLRRGSDLSDILREAVALSAAAVLSPQAGDVRAEHVAAQRDAARVWRDTGARQDH